MSRVLSTWTLGRIHLAHVRTSAQGKLRRNPMLQTGQGEAMNGRCTKGTEART
ncbi:hypothetical protein CsSME_00046153 [Camellia sinensis var. sinensis]